MRFAPPVVSMLFAAALMAAAPALANDKEDAAKPKARKPPVVAVKPVSAPPPRSGQGLVRPPPLSLPSLGGALASNGLASGGLASGGLRGLPPIGDGRAQCRTTCSTARFSCDGQEEGASACAPRWAQCIAACAR